MKKIIVFIVLVIIVLIGAYWYLNQEKVSPEYIWKEYVSKIADQDFDKMYEMLDEESKSRVSKDIFVARNKNIYSRD